MGAPADPDRLDEIKVDDDVATKTPDEKNITMQAAPKQAFGFHEDASPGGKSDDTSQDDMAAQVASASRVGAPNAAAFPPQSQINAALADDDNEDDQA